MSSFWVRLCLSSLKCSHFYLLWKHWVRRNQTWRECPLDSLLKKLCFSIGENLKTRQEAHVCQKGVFCFCISSKIYDYLFLFFMLWSQSSFHSLYLVDAVQWYSGQNGTKTPNLEISFYIRFCWGFSVDSLWNFCLFLFVKQVGSPSLFCFSR